jgi:hypothetical protein
MTLCGDGATRTSAPEDADGGSQRSDAVHLPMLLERGPVRAGRDERGLRAIETGRRGAAGSSPAVRSRYLHSLLKLSIETVSTPAALNVMWTTSWIR